MKRDVERIKRFCRFMEEVNEEIFIRGNKIFNKNNEIIYEY